MGIPSDPQLTPVRIYLFVLSASPRNEGWRPAGGGLSFREPFVTNIVVTVDGRLKKGVIERYERDRDTAVRARFVGTALGPFGTRPGLDVAVPGGELLTSPAVPGSPYMVRFQNAYVNVWVTRSKIVPALRFAFTPYAAYAEGPERLEAMIGAISAELLDADHVRRISRVGMALDLKCSWFEPPAEGDVITRARAVTRVHPSYLATPIFGSGPGGTEFGIYDPIVLAKPEGKEWPGRTDGEDPHDGLRVWRAEFCFHRPAIRKLNLGRPGSAGRGQEDITALADSLQDLVKGALGDGNDRPWVRVAAAGTTGVAPSERPDAWWWEAVREAFLAGIALRPRAAIKPKATPVLRGWRRFLGGVAAVRA